MYVQVHADIVVETALICPTDFCCLDSFLYQVGLIMLESQIHEP